MSTDIKTTGYQTYRELQAQNAEAFTPKQPEMSDWYKGFLQRKISDYGDEPTEYVGRQAADAGFGTSKYDQGLVSASQLGDLQDIRYDNQPWYDTLANGVVKMLGTAGTTFLSSLVGLPAGVATAVAEGRWSGLWDNDVTQALGDVDDWLENNFKNYKSEAQEQNKWWQNMGTMNWWADDVIKNAGFTLGAAASMAVGSGALGLLSKSLGMVNNVSKGAKLANGFVSALFSATGEGMIEARQGVEERNKLEMQKLEDALAPERNAIEMEKEMIDEEYSQTGDFNAYQRKMTDVLRRQHELDSELEAGKQQIEESGREMGNKILLGNQALLTAGNLIQFGKVMTKSFDRARHAAETSSKAVRPTIARATRVGEDISRGYKATGKGLGRLYASSKGLITEGSEEMNQQWIQSSAGAAYNEKDVNDYWRAKLDPDSYRETTRDLYSLGNIINQGFQDSWNDIDQWEQFVIGGMTGMAGSYAPTKIFNQDKTKALYDPRRYGEWGGGAIKEVKEFNKEYNQFEENVDDLNKALADKNFFSRIQSLAARTYAEGKKQEALERGDKKAWKDEDDKQTIHDIQAFLRAGKLDDMRAIYDEMGGDLSDEDVENIIKSTTREVENEDGTKSYEGPFVDKEGNHIVSNDDIRKEVKHNSEELQRKLNSYLDSIQAVQEDTGGRLTKEQEDNLAYLHNMGKESNMRFMKTISKRRGDMPKKFLLKTNKTPEQLTKEYNTSDLTFEKNDSTPEGYVEADTTLMTDNSFADFFMREVMWGGNINPDFGETADEKAQREKEEKDKTLSDEERKKRAMERFTAKMKAVEEKEKEDQEEQQIVNVKRMKKEFTQNYMKNNNATADEALNEWKKLREDVIDASNLLNQAGEYRRTLSEYKSNLQKIDADKKKAEDRAIKKEEKEQVKGMSVRDLSNRDDLDSLLSQAKEEKDIDLINRIKKAKVLREKRAGLDAAENDLSSYSDLDPVERDAAFQIMRQQVENDIDDTETISDHEATAKELADKIADVDEGTVDDHLDKHTIVNIDPKTGKKTLSLKKEDATPAEQGQVAQFMAETPEEYEKQISMLKDRIRNAIRPLDVRLQQMLSEIDVDSIAEEGEEVAKMQKYSDQIKEGENLPDIEPEKKNDRNAPVQTVPNISEPPAEKLPVDGIGEEAILVTDMQQSTNSGMQTAFDSGQHPWFSVAGRVGYHENEPYSATLKRLIDDPNVSEEKKTQYRKQYKRAIAVEKFLERSGAYTRVENGGAQRRGKVKFKVFKEINDEAEDFVIFITDDEQGRILGDLPSSDADIDPNTDKRTGLAELYKEARKQFEEANTDELELKGIESEIDFTYIGKPQYQETRQSVNDLFGGNEFTIALKVVDTKAEAPIAFLDTGKKSLQGKLERDAIKDPLTGSLGQPYILIPTSQATNRNNFKKGYWAVPIATPTFGEIDKDSIFYRTVRQTLEQIRDGKLSETEAKTRLGELFGVANFHVNFESRDSRKGAGIRATTYIRQDGSEKGAPHTLYVGDRASMDVDAVLNELGRFFINIANSQINSKKIYTTVDGTAYTYNQMIGEIATTNVAKPHTVNDWFTIKPVEKKEGKWKISETPTQRISYPSGGNNSLFHVNVPYQDGTTHVWTISPQDWSVRDEQGRAIYLNDSVHSDAEVNVAAIQMARAFGRYYMKDMSKPYVVQVGDQARLFDPTTNTFKTAKELEETPKYRKGASFNGLEDEYNYLMSLEADMVEGFEMAKAELAAVQQQPSENNKIFREKFGSAITDYSYGAQDKYPTFYGILHSTGERVRIDIDTKNNRYTVWVDRALPGEINYKPGQGISYNILVEEDEESYNKVLQELGLPKEFIEAIPKLNELWSDDVKNETDSHDEYLEKEWGIVYGHNALNYKEEKKKAEIRKKVEDTIDRIKADSENYVLTDAQGNENPNGAYYKDKRTGQLHARVTSVKEGDTRVQPFNETDAKGNPNPWILPSTTIGNAVDEFVRAFFAGEDVEVSPLAQNLSEETKKHLREELQKIKTAVEKGNWKIVSNGIVASGTIMVKDVNGDKMAIRVAGTLDLLLYNPEKDEYAIYDMKTHRSAVDGQKELDWAAQLSLYKQLLETKFPELRGKIKALKIVPFSTSGYDAYKQNYEKDEEGRLTSNGEIVKAEVRYDGKTIDLTDKEMNLDISFARPGFKKEYVEGEGAQKIIISKPQPKQGEASKSRVKEGLVKTINKIEAKESVKRFMNSKYEDNKEALLLAEKIDTARKDNNLGELCLTEGEMNLLQDMLNVKKIDRIASFAALDKEGINVQEEEAPAADVADEERSVDDIATEKGILNSATKNAWNRLTDENKEKIVKLRRGVKNVKDELKKCQRLGKDPNAAISGYLHRKADETSGYTIIDMEKEMTWLNRVLPRLSKENKIRIVEGLIKCSDGTWSYGQMKQGLIYLANDGKEGTVYHEAFHAVTQWILTDQELDNLYRAAKERYGNLDTVTLEEKLADDFMLYTMGFEPSYKKKDLNIFQKLWQAVRNMFNHTSMIDNLYRDINDGIYADRVLRTENNEFAHIEQEDRKVSMKYNFLDREQKKKLKEEGISEKQYEVLDADEKRYLFHCVL